VYCFRIDGFFRILIEHRFRELGSHFLAVIAIPVAEA
jgi:hypothetical protein